MSVNGLIFGGEQAGVAVSGRAGDVLEVGVVGSEDLVLGVGNLGVVQGGALCLVGVDLHGGGCGGVSGIVMGVGDDVGCLGAIASSCSVVPARAHVPIGVDALTHGRITSGLLHAAAHPHVGLEPACGSRALDPAALLGAFLGVGGIPHTALDVSLGASLVDINALTVSGVTGIGFGVLMGSGAGLGDGAAVTGLGELCGGGVGLDQVHDLGDGLGAATGHAGHHGWALSVGDCGATRLPGEIQTVSCGDLLLGEGAWFSGIGGGGQHGDGVSVHEVALFGINGVV